MKQLRQGRETPTKVKTKTSLKTAVTATATVSTMKEVEEVLIHKISILAPLTSHLRTARSGATSGVDENSGVERERYAARPTMPTARLPSASRVSN